MDTNFHEDLGRAPPADPGHRATRRDIMAGLPMFAAGAGAALWATALAKPEESLPTGEEAAGLAARVTKVAWPKPKSFVPGMHHEAAYWRLHRLLRSYAGTYLARVGTTPSAPHMLSVADVISEGRCSWSALGAWLDTEHEGFHPDRFPLAWRRARMIDLQRHQDQLARLGAAIS